MSYPLKHIVDQAGRALQRKNLSHARQLLETVLEQYPHHQSAHAALLRCEVAEAKQTGCFREVLGRIDQQLKIPMSVEEREVQLHARADIALSADDPTLMRSTYDMLSDMRPTKQNLWVMRDLVRTGQRRGAFEQRINELTDTGEVAYKFIQNLVPRYMSQASWRNYAYEEQMLKLAAEHSGRPT